MAENCILCGTPLVDGKCTVDHSFKKMCLNCSFCKENEEGKKTCVNEDNLKVAYDKIMAAAAEASASYAVKNLEIAPVPLKKVFSKCSHWTLSDEALEAVKNLFV